MLRDRGLRRCRRRAWQEEASPMEGLANLVDVMLVFSCGLMIAIVLRWNIDLAHVTDVVDRNELVEVEDLQRAVEDGSLSELLNAKGAAFEDPETGKIYIVMP